MKTLKFPLEGPRAIRINCPAKQNTNKITIKSFLMAIPKMACGLLSNRISHILSSPDLNSLLNLGSFKFVSVQPGSIIFLQPA